MTKGAAKKRVHEHKQLAMYSYCEKSHKWHSGQPARKRTQIFSRRWIAIKDGEETHRRTDVDGEKRSTKRLCSFFVIGSSQ